MSCPKYLYNTEFPGRCCIFMSSVGFEKHKPQVSSPPSAWLSESGETWPHPTWVTSCTLILMDHDPITASLCMLTPASWPPGGCPSVSLAPAFSCEISAVLQGPDASLLPSLLLSARALQFYLAPHKLKWVTFLFVFSLLSPYGHSHLCYSTLRLYGSLNTTPMSPPNPQWHPQQLGRCSPNT